MKNTRGFVTSGELARHFDVSSKTARNDIAGINRALSGTGISVYSENSKGFMTELDCNKIHYNNIWIKGHFGASYIQSKRAFELAISHQFPAEKFITRILPLDRINEGIQLTRTGEAIKVVLHPWD